jgi:hypothetical protein
MFANLSFPWNFQTETFILFTNDGIFCLFKNTYFKSTESFLIVPDQVTNNK